jgi:hypothetical protein
MQLVQATSNHVDYISNSLSSYYSKANSFFGYPKYKEDVDTMSKHVSKRISLNDDKFIYLVASENNQNVGFINFTINEFNVGSILVVIADKREVAEELINKGLEYLRSNGVIGIQSEVFLYEKDIYDIFQNIGIEEKLINFTIKT